MPGILSNMVFFGPVFSLVDGPNCISWFACSCSCDRDHGLRERLVIVVMLSGSCDRDL